MLRTVIFSTSLLVHFYLYYDATKSCCSTCFEIVVFSQKGNNVYKSVNKGHKLALAALYVALKSHALPLLFLLASVM